MRIEIKDVDPRDAADSAVAAAATCSACAECGMQVRSGEYHPYAACLMFKGCGKAHTVRENLGYVREDSELMEYLATSWNSQGRGHHIMGRWFSNVSGSFRDAVRCRIDSLPNANSAGTAAQKHS